MCGESGPATGSATLKAVIAQLNYVVDWVPVKYQG
jgi:hypothetical protein|tara:strand:+ start:613 stop:717 length:105 start_codon:yes stop_codon:yes gene_type:complete